MAGRPRVTITDKDKGYKRLRASLESIGRVEVGVLGEAALGSYDGGQSILEVFQKHEYGLGVPRRSVVADYVDEFKDRMRKEAAVEVRRVIDGSTTPVRALARLGDKWSTDMKNRIERNQIKGPDLAPSTVRKKGHDTKLLETRKLQKAISFQVFVGGDPVHLTESGRVTTSARRRGGWNRWIRGGGGA